VVIFGRNTVIQYTAIGNLTGKLHHFVTGGANVNWDISWFPAAVDHVQLDPIHMNKFTVEGYSFHVQQSSQNNYGILHGSQRLLAVNTHVASQGIPPCPNATDHPVGSKIIQCQEGGRQQTNIAGPVVDYTRANFQPFGDSRISRHGDNCIPNQPAFSLPDRFETLFFSITHVIQSITQIMGILQVKRDTIFHLASRGDTGSWSMVSSDRGSAPISRNFRKSSGRSRSSASAGCSNTFTGKPAFSA